MNDRKIYSFFSDNRSEYMYTKYMVEDYKIICYQVRRYTPIPKDMFIIEYNNLKLKVCFENDTIYQKVQNKLKGRNLKEITILFAGKWLKEQDKTYYKIIKN